MFIFSTELNLKSRVEYLSRAIMCVKSVEGETSRGVGQLLTELEEKMEVSVNYFKIISLLDSVGTIAVKSWLRFYIMFIYAPC